MRYQYKLPVDFAPILALSKPQPRVDHLGGTSPATVTLLQASLPRSGSSPNTISGSFPPRLRAGVKDLVEDMLDSLQLEALGIHSRPL